MDKNYSQAISLFALGAITLGIVVFVWYSYEITGKCFQSFCVDGSCNQYCEWEKDYSTLMILLYISIWFSTAWVLKLRKKHK